MFTVALLLIAKIWKKTKCPSVDKWVKKMSQAHTNIIQSLKKKEILPFVTRLMDLECILLSEINQTEKNKFCMISPVCGI